MKPRIMPFLEQGALFNGLNQFYNYNDSSGGNATFATTTVNTFLCPSDGGSNASSTINVPGVGTKPYAGTNYANNQGNSRSFTGGMYDGPAYQLGVSYGGTITLASITDGTSNTAIWSEWVRGIGTLKQGLETIYSSSQSFSASTTSPSPAITGPLGQSIQAVSSTCQSSSSMVSKDKGYSYFEDDMGLGGSYCHLNTPNKKACFYSNDPGWGTVDHGIIGPSSRHSGGVNVGFLDGSVKFIKDSVSYQTWGSLATHQGGEVISSDSY
jgi:prepilin-type processing-associated H-X9-DG protein